MFKKFLMMFFVLALVSACASGSKTGKDGEYDVIETAEDAEQANSKTSTTVQEVSVPDRVYFGFDKYNINSDSVEILNLQTNWLKTDASVNVVVEGHCDERGTREYNLALGERRATSVKNYLVKKGIAANRIKTVSYGKERPIFVGTGESVWSKNRVAVTVVSK